MPDGPVSTERLVSDAFAALEGAAVLDPQTAQQILASTAKALARALPVPDHLYDPALDGPPMLPDEIEAAAIEARRFLELVADLLGGPTDPDWPIFDFAFAGALKKRADWKPPAEPTPAQNKRLAAAARVYELMAEHCYDTGLPPKQEAAVAAVMQEFGLARSKVMQGIREHREGRIDLASVIDGQEGKWRPPTKREELNSAHFHLARWAMVREWFRRNPDAIYLGCPAGSAQEKEQLRLYGPPDRGIED